MKYFDREGNEIKAEEWGRLFRRKDYALVKEDATFLPEGTTNIAVILSWVGCLSDLEPTRDLFLVERKLSDVDEHGIHRWNTVEESWHPTEEAALAAHRELWAKVKAKIAGATSGK